MLKQILAECEAKDEKDINALSNICKFNEYSEYSKCIEHIKTFLIYKFKNPQYLIQWFDKLEFHLLKLAYYGCQDKINQSVELLRNLISSSSVMIINEIIENFNKYNNTKIDSIINHYDLIKNEIRRANEFGLLFDMNDDKYILLSLYNHKYAPICKYTSNEKNLHFMITSKKQAKKLFDLKLKQDREHILSNINNEHIINLLINNPKYIEYYRFNRLNNDTAVKYLLEHPLNIIDSIFASNPNDLAVKYIIDKYQNIRFSTNSDISRINANPNNLAVEFLLKNPSYINLDYLCKNTNPLAIDLYIQTSPNYYSSIFCKNPSEYAVDILLRNPEKINFYSVVENTNPRMIEYCYNNRSKIPNYFRRLSGNESYSAIQIINIHKSDMHLNCLLMNVYNYKNEKLNAFNQMNLLSVTKCQL